MANFTSENSCLLNDKQCPTTTFRLNSNGLRFINGVSSSYEYRYPPELHGIISESELLDIIQRLNETLISFWPCNACYVFGFVCSPFTFGTSLLCPHYCISQSDEHATSMLEQVSLKAKYYDRHISFRIVKRCCESYVEISIPTKLFVIADTGVAAIDDDIEAPSVIISDSKVYSTQPGGNRRLKDT